MARLRTHLLSCGFALVLALPSAAQMITTLDGHRLSAAQASATADAELKRDNVMGAQIAILNRGRVVWTHAYGLRNAEDHLPMETATNIWAASFTKSVFATWAMQQVEQGRLDLDRPVVKILPKPLNAYPDYKESAVDLVTDPRWARVTPRMLLAHTAGLANQTRFEPGGKLLLHFAPGERFAYSGVGINVLQLCLEETLHAPPGSVSIDTLMQHDLFDPLKMTATGMVWREGFAANTAFRYDAAGKFLSATRRSPARAAGNMATSVDDMGRFLEALLGGKLLKPETQAKMLTPQMAIMAAHEFPTLDATPGNEGTRVGLAYGLGWGLLTKTRFGPAFFKEGHGDGAENYMICFTSSGSCMVLLTNSDNGELAFRPLLEQLLGDTVTPWEWEGYTREAVLGNEEHKASNTN